MVERNVNKNLYRVFLLATKIIPMLLAGICFINTILSYFYIEFRIFNYIAGISIIPLAYLYLASYTFKLCEYYRMFLHYYVIMCVINVLDYYIGISLTDFGMLVLYSTITTIAMFIIIYLKFFK